jgi:hypothetical protein
MQMSVQQLTRATESPDTRTAAITELQALAEGTGDKADAARTALAGIGLEVCTESVQATVRRQEKDNSDLGMDIWRLIAEEVTREEDFYRKAKDAGRTAAETVAKLRQEQGIHAATDYGIISNKAELCRRDGVYAAQTYFCPDIRRLLEGVEKYAPHDWPAIELAKATLAQYDPEPKAVIEQPSAPTQPR